MSSPLERVLAALESAGCKPKRSGKEWVARCLAHEDRTASLGIAEGEDGRALVHCLAGCQPAAVLQPLGLMLADLMPSNGRPAQMRGEWRPVLPVPVSAGEPSCELRALGPPSGTWLYRAARGRLLGVVARYEGADGGKEFRVWTFGAEDGEAPRWAPKSWEKGHRPLYGEDRLAARPDAAVLVCEGEKAADAAEVLLPEVVAVTSPHGAKGAAMADWSALAGRRVVIWPDCDPPGLGYAADVSRLTAAAGAASVAIVQLPDVLPHGWDLADVLPDGWTVGKVRELVAAAQPVGEAQPTPKSVLGERWWPIGREALTKAPEPRRYLLRQPPPDGGHGVLPLGKVGFLAAEGGTGKTAVLIALAVSIATERPWLGHYRVSTNAARGRVLLLLGEEDAEEVHRRVWAVGRALDLSPDEQRRCGERILAIPLAGQQVALSTLAAGVVVETALAAELRQRLAADARDGWALVGIDPLSRFAGADVEGSNEAATRFVQIVETLTDAPGRPAVLVAAHTSKLSRRQGTADLRGVTGLGDAARWVATLTQEDGQVLFQVLKSNYTLPVPKLRLRWVDDILQAVNAEERAELDARGRAEEEERKAAEHEAEVDRDVEAVVCALRREGPLSSRNAIARAAGIRAERGRAAVDIALARGRVLRSGTTRHPEYVAAEGPVPGVCVAVPPYNPPGTAGPRPGGDPVRGPGSDRDRVGPPGPQAGDEPEPGCEDVAPENVTEPF